MRFSCHSCHAQYSIADERLRGKLVRFRCRRCQQEILLREDGPAPPAKAATGGWFAGLDGVEQGPLALEELARRLRRGEITPEHFFWRQGMDDWLPLEAVPELAHLSGQASAAGAPPLPAPPPRDARRDARQRAAEQEREAALQRRREAERKATEAAADEARRAQAAREAELAQAEIGRVDTGKFSALGDAAAVPRVVAQAARVDEADAERKQLVERAIKRRAKARVGRHEERVAEEFFLGGVEESGLESLPPPPVGELADAAARQLHQESIHEEYEILEGTDPAAQARRQARDTEAARVAAMQAGVRSQKRRLALALLAIAGLVTSVGGFLTLGLVQGWFTAFTGLGVRSADGELFELDTAVTTHLTPEEARRLRERLLAMQRPGRKPGGKRPQGLDHPGRDPGAEALADVLGEGRPALSESEAALVAFYQGQDGDRPESPALRGLELSALGLQLPGGGKLPAVPLDPALATPEVVPEAPGAAGGSRRLTELQIRLTVQRNRAQVKQCLERQLKKDSSVAGMLELLVRVRPDGKVESVKVATERFRDTYLEDCLVERVGQWVFPSFEGEAYELTLPLMLAAQGGH